MSPVSLVILFACRTALGLMALVASHQGDVPVLLLIIVCMLALNGAARDVL